MCLFRRCALGTLLDREYPISVGDVDGIIGCDRGGIQGRTQIDLRDFFVLGCEFEDQNIAILVTNVHSIVRNQG
jgi:3-dehydroquinate synthase class II